MLYDTDMHNVHMVGGWGLLCLFIADSVCYTLKCIRLVHYVCECCCVDVHK